MAHWGIRCNCGESGYVQGETQADASERLREEGWRATGTEGMSCPKCVSEQREAQPSEK